MVKPEVLDAMLAAGCTAEQIVAVVKASASAPVEPSAAAERMRRYRQRREDLGMPQAFDGGKYRPAIAARDGEHCAYCAAVGRTEIDHVVPIIQGGTDDIDNLVFACRACNGKKSGRTPEEAGMKFSSESAHSAHVRYIERTLRTERTEQRTDAPVSLSPVPLLSPHTPLITPLPPNPSTKTSNARGHRLPEDWVFSGPDLAFALSKGFTAEQAAEIFEKFTNFWWSASGKSAVKKNWHQAWRVWLLNEKPSARAGPARPLTAFQQRRNETQDILNGLDNFARNGSLSSEKDTRLLGYDPGQRSTAVRDGPCEDADDLSFAGDRARN